MTRGQRALLVVIASIALGAVYVIYLNSVDFPPAGARLLPFLWLATAIAGWVLSMRAVRTDAYRPLAFISLARNVPNTAFAGMFAFAALMGD